VFSSAPVWWLCWSLLLANGGLAVAAEVVSAPEYKVKAAFLYNFAKLTEWPTNAFADTNAAFVIGIVGKDPFDSQLEEVVRGKTIGGRAIAITRLASADEAKACQLLFVSRSENGRVPAMLAGLAGQPILTVGDAPDFARRGGIIGLVEVRDEIHFEINRATAAQAGLKLSSKLLRLADIVQPEAERRGD